MAQYWIIRDGKSVGPIPEDRLYLERVTADTKVWRKGMTAWTRADQVPELAPNFLNRQSVNVSAPPSKYDETASRRCPYAHKVAAIVVSVVAILVLCGSSLIDIFLDPFFYLILPFCCMSVVSAFRCASVWKDGNIKKARRLSGRAYLWIVLTVVATLVLLPFHIVASLFF